MFLSSNCRRLQAISVVVDLEGFSTFCTHPDNHARLASYLNFVFQQANESLSTKDLVDRWLHRKFLGDGALYIWEIDEQDPSAVGGRVFLAMHNFFRMYPVDIQDQYEELSLRRPPARIRVGIAQGEICELASDKDFEYVGYSINLAARLQSYCRKIGFLVSSTVSLPDDIRDEYSLVRARTKNIKGLPSFSEDVRYVKQDASLMSQRELKQWFESIQEN